MYFFPIPTPQESVTDYTTPSSSLPNTVAASNAKMEDTLVNNVSNQPEIWQVWIGTWLLLSNMYCMTNIYSSQGKS